MAFVATARAVYGWGESVMRSSAAITLTGVAKRYQVYHSPWQRMLGMLFPRLRAKAQEFIALDGISLQVEQGESVALIGRNGSGKSTLLQIICQTLEPTSGRVDVNGRIAALLELGAGFNSEFTGRENIRLNAAIYGLSPQEIEAKLPRIIEFAEIGAYIDQPVKTYSSGMFLRLAFAVIVHVDADILVIDEALAVGDMRFVQKCMRFIREFSERGTLLFVSHDVGMVTGLCDRAVWLDQAAVRQDGQAKAVTEAYIAALYEHTSPPSRDAPTAAKSKPDSAKPAAEAAPDYRHQQLHDPEIANQIAVLDQQLVSNGFGTQQGVINAVQIIQGGKPLAVIMGGEPIILQIDFSVQKDVGHLVVGFAVKDRLGQFLFGDNTLYAGEQSGCHLQAGQSGQACFAFVMPYLARGEYAVSVALAEYDDDEHTQLDWQHEALLFRSDNTHTATGLIGIPMQEITLQRQER